MSKIVVIDPGHGKNGNKSPNNPKYVEGTQMWHLANMLKEELEKYADVEVITTRPNLDDDPSLYNRGSIAGKRGAKIFVSLHSNAPGKSDDGTYPESVTGSVVYYSLTKPENVDFADTIGNKVAELMGHYYRGSKTREYPNAPHRDYYGVIRAAAETGCKEAFLIEHGFHTNIHDSNWLLDDSNKRMLAKEEAALIAEYIGATLSPEPAESSVSVVCPHCGKSIRVVLNKATDDPQDPPKPREYKVGDIVTFKGDTHYTNPDASTPKSCKGGPAEITHTHEGGKHPWHLVRVSGKGATVYGWVDEGTFE